MDLSSLPTFAGPDIFHVIVEAPRGSTLKLKYEPRWEAMTISRPLPIGVRFPFDWGFVPSTRGPDGDPIDAMVLWDLSSVPGLVMPCRAVGVLQVEQNRANNDPTARIRNDRLLALPVDARREDDHLATATMNARLRLEIERFTIAATELEGKDVRIVGWGDAKTALQLIRDSAA